MNAEEFDIQIFILSQSKGFEELSHNHKFLMIVEQADASIQKWYYKKVSKNNIPNSLDTFVLELKTFIPGKTFEEMFRYSEESWSEYLQRLKIYCDSVDLTDDDIIAKLRRSRAPKVLECIFFQLAITF
ncbi:hypothetical protein DMUE_2306 [Dictyocoela muelleri]|nr:hypothetical protein DMUE_2306 [Dictyocoela muelleri]